MSTPDSRFTIDLVIQARDKTAAAFASVLGQQEKLARVQERNARDLEAANKRLETSTKSLDVTQRKVNAERISEYRTIAGRIAEVDDKIKRQSRSIADQGLALNKAKARVQELTDAYEAQNKKVTDLKGKEAEAFTKATNNLRAQQREMGKLGNELDELRAKQAKLRDFLSNDDFPNQTQKQIALVQRLSDRYAKMQADGKALDQDRKNATQELYAETRKLQVLLSTASTQEAALADKSAAAAAQRIRRNQLEISQQEQINKLRRESNDIGTRLGSKAADDLDVRGDLLRRANEIDNALRRLRVEQADFEIIQNERAAKQTVALEERAQGAISQLLKQKAAERAQIIKDQEAQVESLTKRERNRRKAELQQQLDDLLKRNRAEEEAERQTIINQEKINKQRLSLERQYQSAVEAAAKARLRSEDAGKRVDLSRDFKTTINLDAADAERRAAAARAELEAIVGTVHSRLDLDIDAAVAKLAAFRALASRPLDTGAGGGRGGIFSKLFQGVPEEFERAGNRIATFDNLLRGLTSIAITFFFNQIITLASAAAGALLALASSALQAGAALGGALVSGLAQAIPVIGLVAAAVTRITAVIQAVKQANLLQQQQSAQREKGLNKEKSATDAVVNAQDSLIAANQRVVEANERVGEAQKRLTEARSEARRQLTDLILAEREAELAAKGAVLSQQEAQAALRRAISEGRTEDIARAQLSVQEADLGVDQSRVRLGRARRANTAGQAAGISRAPGVLEATKNLQQARQAVTDAERAADRARRGLDAARRSANVAGADSLAAAGKLEFLLGQLSPAERRLYTALKNIQNQFRGFAQKTTGPLIDGFAKGLGRISEILGDRKVISAFTSLATSLTDSIGKIFDQLTNDKSVGRFINLITEFQRNLRPITNIFINLNRIFLGLAEAAEPALEIILDYLSRITEKFATLLETPNGSSAAEQFLTRGAEILTKWVDLLGSIGNLFLAIAGQGGGAEAGLSLVERMTELFNGLATQIRESPEGLQTFFLRTRQVFEALLPLFGAFGRLIANAFDDQGVKNVEHFVNLLTTVLLPVLSKVIETIGLVSRAFSYLAENPVGRVILQMTLLATVLGGLLSKIGAIFAPLGRLARNFAAVAGFSTKIARLGPAMETFATSLGKVEGPFRIIARLAGSLLLAVTGLINKTPALAGVAKALGLVRGAGVAAEAAAAAGGAAAASRGAGGVAGALVGGAAAGGILSRLRGGVAGSTYGLARSFGRGRVASLVAQGGSLLRSSSVAGIVAGIGAGVLGDRIGGTAGSALKGAATGAAIGSFIPGIGTGAGAAIGGIGAGALSFFKNKELNDKIKEAKERVDGFRESLKKISESNNRAGLSKLKDAFLDFAQGAPEQVRKQIEELAGDFDKQFSKITRVLTRSNKIIDLGVELQIDVKNKEKQKRDIDKYLSDLFRTEKSPEARAAGRKKVEALIQGMQDRKQISVDTANDLRKSLNTQFDKLTHDQKVSNAKALRASARLALQITQAAVSGHAAIAARTNKILDAFGVKPVRGFAGGAISGALAGVLTQLSGAVAGDDAKAAGGFIGNPGERGKDRYRTWLGRGEVVLNAAQQAMVNAKMAGQDTLHSIVSRMRGYHAGGPEQPGFASGGGDLFDGHPSDVNASVRRIIRLMKRKFPLTVTSTTDHRRLTTSGNVSDHVEHAAVDLAGSKTVMNRAAAYVLSSGLVRQLKQAIYSGDPSLTYSGGKNVGAGFFGPAVMAQHANHLHLAATGAIGKLADVISTRLPRVKFDGPVTGTYAEFAQKSIDKVRRAAQQYINKKTSDGIEYDQGGGLTSAGGQYDKEELKRLWIRAGGRRSSANIAAAIALAESGGNPRAQNSIGATGLWQILISAHPDWAKGNLFDPLWNAKAAVAISSNGRNWNPWTVYTGADTPGHEKTYLRYLSAGGPVGGSGTGDTVPAMLTPGEHVWTAAEVARAGGHNVMRMMRRMFGGGGQGGPFKYASGGSVPSFVTERFTERKTDEEERHEKRLAKLKKDNNADEIKRENEKHKERLKQIKEERDAAVARYQSATPAGQRVIAARQGVFVPLVNNPRSVGGVRDEIGRAERARQNIGGRGANARGVDRFIADIGALTDDGGLLDQLQTAIEKRAAGISRFVRAVVVNARKKGEPLTATQQLAAELEALKDTAPLIQGEIDTMSKTLASVTRKIKTVRKALAANTAEIRGYDRRIAQLDDGNVSKEDQKKIDKLKDLRKAAIGRRGSREAQLQKLIGAQNNLKDSIDEATDSLLQAEEDRLAKEQELFKAQVDELLKGTQTKIGGFSNAVARRIAAAVGNGSQVAAIDDQNLKDMQAQAAILKQKALEANAKGFTELGDELQSQFEELYASIQEATAAQFQRKIDDVNATAQRSLSRLDRSGRLADLKAAAGDVLGAARDRISNSTSRQGVLEGQRSELLALIGGREAFNKLKDLPLDQLTEAQKALIEQIEDLDVTVQENAQATKDLRIAYIDATVDQVLNRGANATGFGNSAIGIFQKLAQIAGNSLGQNGNIRAALDSIAASLKNTRGEIVNATIAAVNDPQNGLPAPLRGLLTGLAGAFAEGPEGFARYLASNGGNLAQLISQLPENAQNVVNKLIGAMVDNTGATLDNNEQLQNLNGTVQQSFSSTAWQLFRTAIFNGSGGLLPQYSVPQMETGGYVTKGGLFELHAGEHVINPSREQLNAGGDTIVQITSPTEVLDPSYVAEVLAFRRSLERAT